MYASERQLIVGRRGAAASPAVATRHCSRCCRRRADTRRTNVAGFLIYRVAFTEMYVDCMGFHGAAEPVCPAVQLSAALTSETLD